MKILFLLSMCTIMSACMGKGKITSYQTPGNLIITHNLSCEGSEKLKNTYTPADLYPAVSECIKENKYEEAIYHFMLANAYGYFDAHRVSDKSARQAIPALQANNLWGLDEKIKKSFTEEFKLFTSDSETMGKACRFLEKIGKPNYHPSYMIQHGLDAFTGISGDGTVPGADLVSIWNDAMVKYIKCAEQR